VSVFQENNSYFLSTYCLRPSNFIKQWVTPVLPLLQVWLYCLHEFICPHSSVHFYSRKLQIYFDRFSAHCETHIWNSAASSPLKLVCGLISTFHATKPVCSLSRKRDHSGQMCQHWDAIWSFGGYTGEKSPKLTKQKVTTDQFIGQKRSEGHFTQNIVPTVTSLYTHNFPVY